MDNEEKVPITAWSSPFLGIWHFLKHPSLWFGPIIFSMFSWGFLAVVFFSMLYWHWPEEGILPLNFIGGIWEAFALALSSILFIWAFILPIFLDFAFEKMLRRFLKLKGIELGEKHMSVKSGLYILYKTCIWRFIYLFFSILSAILVPPLSLLISGIGIAHIAFVDAADLALTLQGFSPSQRIAEIRERDPWFLLAGVVGGILGLILLPSFIGWLIWLPSMYIGSTLWSLHWGITPSEYE